MSELLPELRRPMPPEMLHEWMQYCRRNVRSAVDYERLKWEHRTGHLVDLTGCPEIIPR